MQLHRSKDRALLRELRADMAQLAAHGGDAISLYRTPEYLDTYLDTFTDRAFETYAVSDNGTLQGLAVFAVHDVQGRRVLRFAGEGLWGYTGALHGGDGGEEMLVPLLSAALQHSGCHALEIGPLHGDVLPMYLAAVRRLGVAAQAYQIPGGAPFIDPRGRDRDTWVRSLKKAAWADALRCEKRLGEQGAVTLFKLDNASATPAQCQHAMSLFLQMYHRQWPENRFRRDARWRPFYEAFALAAAGAGTLEFSFLALDGRPVAAHYGFLHRGRRYYFTPTYDVDYGRYSPGKILLRHLIDTSFEQQVVFDFQNDLEPYKLDWATGVADRFLIKLLPH
jgi:CelD/BcsL family acetyltransferase involved in cellulose biosynthesis